MDLNLGVITEFSINILKPGILDVLFAKHHSAFLWSTRVPLREDWKNELFTIHYTNTFEFYTIYVWKIIIIRITKSMYTYIWLKSSQ